MKQDISIVWFRLDLRRTDNPALTAAAQYGRMLIPVFIWAPGEEGAWPPGAASRWWLHHSLKSLAADLGGLVIRRGPSLNALRQLVKETGATAVFWNRRYEPALMARDTKVKQALLADGLQVESFNSALLFEPWEIKNGSGEPYRVFTPFWRAYVAKAINETLVAAQRLAGPKTWPVSLKLADLELLPKRNWARSSCWSRVWSRCRSGCARPGRSFVCRSTASS
jgi:deoxyribodipyrimidine photo-lyase